jgi:hypothetical protein
VRNGSLSFIFLDSAVTNEIGLYWNMQDILPFLIQTFRLRIKLNTFWVGNGQSEILYTQHFTGVKPVNYEHVRNRVLI